MWYKEENGKLVAPPINFKTPEGATICNFNLSSKYMTKYGWRNWTDEEIEQWHNDHPEPKPIITVNQLTELTYQAKAKIAYGGITFIKNGISYQFDTDQNSITMCNGQILSMISKESDFTFGWKVYANNLPVMLEITKQEFVQIYEFGMIMINSAFTLEGNLNAEYGMMTSEELQELNLEEEASKISAEFNNIQKIFEI